ncbi:MAG: MFS transporter [Microthrixaceae bacterium]|nr:MFS transporter [Microthrixaceae bacterium]
MLNPSQSADNQGAKRNVPETRAEETYGIDPTIYHRRWGILAVLCISLVTIVIAVSSLNVAIPTIIRELNASSTESLWIIESYALVFAVILLPAGAIGDRFGRKWALLGGLVIFGGLAVVASFSTDPTQLIATRAVMGIGAALIMPATLSIITNVFPPHERQRAIATWAGLAGAGGALGPLMSGLVLKAGWWWGSVFLVNVPLVVLLIALSTFLVPNSKNPNGERLDPPGALLSVVTLGALVFGIIEGPEKGWLNGLVLGSFALAIVAGAAFVAWELKATHPMLDPRLFKLRGFGMGSLTITLSFFCMFGTFFLISQYLQFVHGYDALGSAVRTLPSAVVMVIVSPRSPKLVARFGLRNCVRAGFLLIAAGFLGMASLGPDTAYWQVAVFLCLMSAGMASLMPPASGMIVSSLPLSKAGVGSAVNDVTREVGGALGIAIMGSVLASGYSSRMADKIAAFPIPPQFRDLIEDSIGPAFGVADQAQARGLIDAERAQFLRDAARESFVSGSRIAFLVAVGVALLGTLVAGNLIPNESPVPGGAPEPVGTSPS